MDGYNKVFFHMSSQGIRTGWGDLVRACDAAGIPVSVMSVGGEGIGDIVAQWDAGSTVPHVPVFRPNGNDVPPYGANIETAAPEWWAWMKSQFSKEIYRYHDRIVIKHGNELDKNQSDWLGQFFTRVAKLAMSDPDGPFITAPFGFSAGEPEQADWITPGMKEYLYLAHSFPYYVYICLHEYSLDASNIFADSPYNVGRFLMLFSICDELGLRRPNIVLHEVGWELGDIPDTPTAMAQLNSLAELYAYYPEIKGAGIWTTQPYNNTGIEKKVSALIPLVKEMTLNNRYPVGETVPPEPKHKVVVYKLAQEHTREQWQEIADIAHDDYKRTQTASHNDAETMYLEGNEESYIVVIDPELASQQHAIQYFAERGYMYQTKYIFTEPPTQPETFKYSVWPTVEHRITQYFGEHPENYNKYGFPGHEGIDLAAPLGSAIYAPEGGVVIKVSDKTSSGNLSNYGQHVIIDHENGYYTTLGHLRYDTLVQVGDRVDASQIIGYSGNTGNSYGAHLHLTLKKDGYVHPGWECCPGYKDPLPHLQSAQIPPGQGELIYLVPYLRPADLRGRLYEVETKIDGVSHGQQRHQSQRDADSSIFYHTKGGDGPSHPAEWEQLDIQDGHIRRYIDTSMGGGRYYTLTKQGTDEPFVDWLLTSMRINQVFVSYPLVTIHNKDTCNMVSGPDATTDYLKLARKHDTFECYNGIILQDVIEIHWSKSPTFERVEEKYFYSKDPRAEGLVGWGSLVSGKVARVSELHDPGQRPDNFRETGCFS